MAARKAHSATAKAPVASGKGLSHGAKKPPDTTSPVSRMSPEAMAPTHMPSSAGASRLATENTPPQRRRRASPSS